MIQTFYDCFLVTFLVVAGLWLSAVVFLLILSCILDLVNLIIRCPDSIRVVNNALEWIFFKGVRS